VNGQPGILMDVHSVLRRITESFATSASSVRTDWTTY